MRGQLTLFQYFHTNTTAVRDEQRPRNFFMPERNIALVHRYYFYSEIKCYRYEKCLEELEQDFFITDTRQVCILTDCQDLLRQVMQQKPSLKELSRKFPRFNWNL